MDIFTVIKRRQSSYDEHVLTAGGPPGRLVAACRRGGHHFLERWRRPPTHFVIG